MKISEVQPGMSGVNITGTIKSIGAIRDVNTKFGKQTRVANATLKDDSGEIQLTLWAEQIEKVSEGSTIEILNGFAREWQGETQVSVGRGELKIR
jgi:replication factor A1